MRVLALIIYFCKTCMKHSDYWHGLCEAVSGCVNRPKTLGECARDSGTIFGQCRD